MKTISRYYFIWMMTSLMMFLSLGIYLFLWLNLSNVVFGSVGAPYLITHIIPFILVFLGYIFYKFIKENSAKKFQKNENILKFIYGLSVSNICSWILISIYNEIPFLHFRLSQSLGVYGSQLILTLGITLPTFLLVGMCWRAYFEKITKTKYFITSTVVFNMFVILIGFSLCEKYLANFQKFESLFFLILLLGVLSFILLLFIISKSDKLRTGIYIGLLYLFSLIPVINLESLRIGFNLNNYNQSVLDTEKLNAIRFDSQDQVIFQSIQYPYLIQGVSRPVAQGDFIIKQNGNLVYKSPDLNQSYFKLLNLLTDFKSNEKLNVTFFKFESLLENIDFVIENNIDNILIFDSRMQLENYINNLYNQHVKLDHVNNSFILKSNDIKNCKFANTKEFNFDSDIKCFLNLHWENSKNVQNLVNEMTYKKNDLIISVENNLKVEGSMDGLSSDFYKSVSDYLLPDGLFYQKVNFQNINKFQFEFILLSLSKNFKNVSYVKVEDSFEIIANNGLNFEEFNNIKNKINQKLNNSLMNGEMNFVEENEQVEHVELNDLKFDKVDYDNEFSGQVSFLNSFKWYENINDIQEVNSFNESANLDLIPLKTFKLRQNEIRLKNVGSLWRSFSETHPYDKQKNEILEQIIKVGTSDDKFKALVFLSELYLEKSDFINSFNVARKIQKYFPSRVESYFLMSESLIQSKKIDLAKEILKVGLYYLPDNQRLNTLLNSLERVY